MERTALPGRLAWQLGRVVAVVVETPRVKSLLHDGNAAGGVLGQIFAFEMTTTEVICAHCDVVGPIGAAMVYATAMGTIIRCPRCREALMRIAHGPQR